MAILSGWKRENGNNWVECSEKWSEMETPPEELNGINTVFSTLNNYVGKKILIYRNGRKIVEGENYSEGTCI